MDPDGGVVSVCTVSFCFVGCLDDLEGAVGAAPARVAAADAVAGADAIVGAGVGAGGEGAGGSGVPGETATEIVAAATEAVVVAVF